MLAVYLLTLGVSAGMAGLYAHRVLAEHGFAPTFGVGLWLALGAAFTYAAFQLLYMLLIQMYKPTRDPTFYFLENLSHGAALLLAPYIFRMDVTLPHAVLERAEPLVWAAAFAGLHLAFKFMSFYAAVRGVPARRLPALAWAAAALVCGAIGLAGLARGAALLENWRPTVTEGPEPRRVGDQYAVGRSIPEGAIAEYDISAAGGRAITLLWAPEPDDGADDAVRVAHVTCIATGSETRRSSHTVELRPDRWTVLHLPENDIPADARTCRILWNARSAPAWQRLWGFTPVVTSSRRLLVAGPILAEPRKENTALNLVILVLDGVTAHRAFAYAPTGQPLPSLDRLAAAGANFTNAYTPAPDPAAAAMSLLTGMAPLQHGYLGSRRGPLPRDCRTLPERLRDRGYLTAAFTEADADDSGEFAYRSEFERGFDLYDTGAYPRDASHAIHIADSDSSAARDTFARALEWMSDNRETKHLVFVRVRDLLSAAGAVAPQPDAAARPAPPNPDRPLAAFIKAVRADANTGLVVTASSGARWDDDPSPTERLAEPALRVPLILCGPYIRVQKHDRILSLDEVTQMLLKLTGGEAPFPEPAEDSDDKAPAVTGDAVSVWSDPLALSLRTGKWRLTWQTDRPAFASISAPIGGRMALYDVDALRRGQAPSDLSVRYKTQAARLRERLETYLETVGQSSPTAEVN